MISKYTLECIQNFKIFLEEHTLKSLSNETENRYTHARQRNRHIIPPQYLKKYTPMYNKDFFFFLPLINGHSFRHTPPNNDDDNAMQAFPQEKKNVC